MSLQLTTLRRDRWETQIYLTRSETLYTHYENYVRTEHYTPSIIYTHCTNYVRTTKSYKWTVQPKMLRWLWTETRITSRANQTYKKRHRGNPILGGTDPLPAHMEGPTTHRLGCELGGELQLPGLGGSNDLSTWLHFWDWCCDKT